VIHPRYDGDPLNRAYLYNGENTDSYLMKAHEALASCEEMIPGGWTVETLEDLIVDAGMTLYDLAVGYEGPLQENKMIKDPTSEDLVIGFRDYLNEEKINIANALNELLNKYKDRYWVFFDTETSGLDKTKEQILEVAAIVVDPEYLTKDVEPIETFHQKSKLTRRLKVRLQHPLVKPLPQGQLSTKDVLKMTKYGMPSKRKGSDPNAALYGSIPMEDATVTLKKFKTFLEKRNAEKPILLIAHNAKFDVEITNEKLREYGVPEMQFESLDTLVLIRSFFGPLLKIAAKMEETDPNRKQELVDLFKTLNLKAYDKARERGDISSRLGHLVQALNIKDKGWHSAIADVRMLMEVMKEVVRIIRENPSIEKDSTEKKSLKQKQPEALQEAKLSKTWRRRAIARARRNEREYPNKIDKSWALKQQEKWNKKHPELEQEYLKEIELAQNLMKTTKEYLQKMKDIRKQKLEAKRKDGMPPKFGPNDKPKGTLPSLDVKNKKGPLSKIKRAQKKAKEYGGATYSSATFSPSESVLEELEIIELDEEIN